MRATLGFEQGAMKEGARVIPYHSALGEQMN